MNNTPKPSNTPNPGENKPSANTNPTDRKRPAPELLEQAASLFQSGWHYRQTDDSSAIYFVHNRSLGCCYIVFIMLDYTQSYCTCQTFSAEGDCVHLLAIQHELVWLARIEAQEREMEERERYAEHPLYGTEPEPGAEW